MDTADLKEYLSIIVDLEKNRYLQEKLIAGLRQKISRLGIPAKLTMPTGPRLRNNFHDLFLHILHDTFCKEVKHNDLRI